MKKINNTLDANNYYKIVNDIVDKYISDHRIRPSELSRYFMKNMDYFLESSNLNDIDGIKTVVMDVLQHRHSMEMDNVITFEKFKMSESLLNIGDPSINHIKILADYYHTSVGHVESIDKNIHLFSINDFGKVIKSIIFSEEELNKIYNNVEQISLNESSERTLVISKIDNIELSEKISFKLSEIISDDKFKTLFKEKVNKEKMIIVINDLIKDNKNKFDFSNKKISYKENFKNFHIWEIS